MSKNFVYVDAEMSDWVLGGGIVVVRAYERVSLVLIAEYICAMQSRNVWQYRIEYNIFLDEWKCLFGAKDPFFSVCFSTQISFVLSVYVTLLLQEYFVFYCGQPQSQRVWRNGPRVSSTPKYAAHVEWGGRDKYSEESRVDKNTAQ